MIKAAIRRAIQQLTRRLYIRGLPRLLWLARRILAPRPEDDGSCVVSLPNGSLFAVPLNDYFQWMSVWGYFQPEVEDVILQHMREGDTFVDVGANTGLFTLAARQRVGPNGRVVAIEPEPRARAMLERNIALNGYGGEITTLACAISRSSGTIPFEVAKQLGHSTALVRYAGIETAENITVESLTLDTALEAVEVRPEDVALVKVDVEGLEVDVLEGAQRVLVGDAAMIIEVNQHTLAASGTSFEQIWEAISERARPILWIDTRQHPFRRSDSYGLRPLSGPSDIAGLSGDIFVPRRAFSR